MKNIKLFGLTLGCFLTLSNFAWNPFSSKKEVKIGFAWSDEDSLVEKGVDLAIREMNYSDKSKSIFKKVNLSDEGSISTALMNAEKATSIKRMVAVVGHKQSYISVPASIVYELKKVIMMNPASTSNELISKGYEYIFRTIPGDRKISKSIVKYLLEKGYKNTLLCFVDNDYGKSFANSFEENCKEEKISTSDRISYEIGDVREFNRIIDKWSNYSFDSIMFIGYMPEGIDFIRAVKAKNISVPIVCSEAMASSSLIEDLGKDAEGIIFPALFHTEEEEAKEFSLKFKKQYGIYPDPVSAIAYDSVKMLEKAMLSADSILPKKVSKALKKIEYKGVANNYSFDSNGELIGNKRVGMQIVQNGKFKYLGDF